MLPLNGFNLVNAKQKTSQETERRLRKFLEPSEKPKVIYTGSLANLVMKNYHEIIELRHLIDPRQMVLRSERCAGKKERTSAVLLQSGEDEKWWADSMECQRYLRNVQDSLGRWENYP